MSDLQSLAPPCLVLPDAQATDRLGRLLADHLEPGDTLLLEGQIGAGKTQLSRALIRARMGDRCEVPSPSFTLIQTYGEGTDAIWHADLYRLVHPDELRELGLEDAFDQALCLIEWPDRMVSHLPAHALHLTLNPQGEGRCAVLTGGRAGLARAIQAAWDAADAG